MILTNLRYKVHTKGMMISTQLNIVLTDILFWVVLTKYYLLAGYLISYHTMIHFWEYALSILLFTENWVFSFSSLLYKQTKCTKILVKVLCLASYFIFSHNLLFIHFVNGCIFLSHFFIIVFFPFSFELATAPRTFLILFTH